MSLPSKEDIPLPLGVYRNADHRDDSLAQLRTTLGLQHSLLSSYPSVEFRGYVTMASYHYINAAYISIYISRSYGESRVYSWIIRTPPGISKLRDASSKMAILGIERGIEMIFCRP